MIHFLLSSDSPAGAEVTASFLGFNHSTGCDRLTRGSRCTSNYQCQNTHTHTLLMWTQCGSPQPPVIYLQAEMSYLCKSSGKK